MLFTLHHKMNSALLAYLGRLLTVVAFLASSALANDCSPVCFNEFGMMGCTNYKTGHMYCQKMWSSLGSFPNTECFKLCQFCVDRRCHEEICNTEMLLLNGCSLKRLGLLNGATWQDF